VDQYQIQGLRATQNDSRPLMWRMIKRGDKKKYMEDGVVLCGGTKKSRGMSESVSDGKKIQGGDSKERQGKVLTPARNWAYA